MKGVENVGRMVSVVVCMLPKNIGRMVSVVVCMFSCGGVGTAHLSNIGQLLIWVCVHVCACLCVNLTVRTALLYVYGMRRVYLCVYMYKCISICIYMYTFVKYS